MDIPAYLDRINYRGSLIPSASTLHNLHLAHLMNVPFENLSIHYGQPIVLNDEALFEKVVGQRRGGFCYELNGAFASLLRGLGFKVEKLSARVANSEGEFGPDFDHMTLLVSLEKRWLADVGFGDSFLAPLELDNPEIQIQGNRAYKIAPQDDRLCLWQRVDDGDWKPQYSFTLDAYEYPAYEDMCRYHETSPQSHFTRSRICTRATENGRLTLSELKFITTVNGERSEQLLLDENEYAEALVRNFGVKLTGVKKAIH